LRRYKRAFRIRVRLSCDLGYTKTDLKQAQLSQRDRAMLRVTEYFAKSLKVIENDVPFERLSSHSDALINTRESAG